MHENWKRWIFASLAQHFNAAKGDLQIFHVQHTARDFEETGERIEFRVDGPEEKRISKTKYNLKVGVNLLITCPVGSYRIHVLTGRFQKPANGPIIVKKYGDQSGDDESEVACLQLIENVEVHDFGQLDPAVNITQSTIEAFYQADFQE